MKRKTGDNLLIQRGITGLRHAVGILRLHKFRKALFCKAAVASQAKGKQRLKPCIHGILGLLIIGAILKGFVHTVVYGAYTGFP